MPAIKRKSAAKEMPRAGKRQKANSGKKIEKKEEKKVMKKAVLQVDPVEEKLGTIRSHIEAAEYDSILYSY